MFSPESLNALYRYSYSLAGNETDAYDLLQDALARYLERIVISQQTLQQIWARLTPLERELMYLWAAEGMNAREIAEQLDTPRGTILSRIHRLRKKIQPLADSVDTQADGDHSI